MIPKRVALAVILVCLMCAVPSVARPNIQETAASASRSVDSTPKPASPKSASTKSHAKAARKAPPKPVLYINEVQSAKSDVSAHGEFAEVLGQDCPGITLTENKSKAGYEVAFQRKPASKSFKTGFGLASGIHKTYTLEIISKNGNPIFADSGHSASQLARNACSAMTTPETTLAQK